MPTFFTKLNKKILKKKKIYILLVGASAEIEFIVFECWGKGVTAAFFIQL